MCTPPSRTNLAPAARAAFCSSRGVHHRLARLGPARHRNDAVLTIRRKVALQGANEIGGAPLMSRRLIGRLTGRVDIIEIQNRQRDGLGRRNIGSRALPAKRGCQADKCNDCNGTECAMHRPPPSNDLRARGLTPPTPAHRGASSSLWRPSYSLHRRRQRNGRGRFGSPREQSTSPAPPPAGRRPSGQTRPQR